MKCKVTFVEVHRFNRLDSSHIVACRKKANVNINLAIQTYHSAKITMVKLQFRKVTMKEDTEKVGLKHFILTYCLCELDVTK